MNARMERAANSTLGLGVLLAPLDWRWTKTRAIVFAAVCWAAAVVLVVTW